MYASLRLEVIDDNVRGRIRLFQAMCREAKLGVIATAFNPPPNRPWVARITGLDEKYGLKREFESGRMDYREANSVGSRGVYINYMLDDAYIYDVSERVSRRSRDRRFCRFEMGREIRMTKEDVTEWLKSKGLA